MRALTILILLTGFATGANADVVQNAAIASRGAGWKDRLVFQKADPAQGALTSVTLGLTGDVGGTLQIENRDSAGVALNSYSEGNITAGLPSGGTFVSVNPFASNNTKLGAFDGAVDFAGTSGRTIAFDSGATTASRTLNVGPYSAGLGSAKSFIGKGQVSLPVSASVFSSVQAGGNVTGRVLPTIGANGTLIYSQATPGMPAAPGSSSSVGSTAISSSTEPTTLGRVATTAVQEQVLVAQATGWSALVRFNPFDTRLGTLFSVNLSLASPTSFAQKVSAIGAGSTIEVKQHASLTLDLFNGTNLLTTVTDKRTGYAVGADATGGGDFALSSGSRQRFYDSAGFTAFSGAGPIDLALASTGTSTVGGTGGFGFDLGALAGADVRLSYSYYTGPIGQIGVVSEPGSGIVMAAPVIALLARRRRARTA